MQIKSSSVTGKNRVGQVTRNIHIFLAHLSLQAHKVSLQYTHGPSSVVVVRCRRPFTFSNVFSSETAWPIKAKFYVEPPCEGGTKVYINDPGHMTKMAAMLKKCSKPLKIFFSGTGGPISMKLGIWHRGLRLIIVYINDDPGLTLTYFTTRSNLVTQAFLQEKVKTVDFSEHLQPVT